MNEFGFSTTVSTEGAALSGPWCAPMQMLGEQSYDGHASIHDDATAQKLGFRGGTIEGPTHFSQFVPLGVSLWGQEFLESGCISAHYRKLSSKARRSVRFCSPAAGGTHAEIWMEKRTARKLCAARYRWPAIRRRRRWSAGLPA
jgi:hypothetical protein